MKPVRNIRVVELSTMLVDPMTTRILAKWGAGVVKVKSVNGDTWCKQAGVTLSPYTKNTDPSSNAQNMNKRLVCLNLRTEAGRDATIKLLSGTDIFITNYRVQALEPVGLTYEQLKETLSRPVHTPVLDYGSENLESSHPRYNYTVFFVKADLVTDLTPTGDPPLTPVGGTGDHSVAVVLSGDIAAVLYKRSVTGERNKVDISPLRADTFINCTGVLNDFSGRKLLQNRCDCGHASNDTYQGSDGEWFCLATIDYRYFPKFYQVIDMPEIIANSGSSTSDVYYENRGKLTKVLGKEFAEQPVSYWRELLDARDLPYEALHRFKDIPYDPQVQANHYTYFHGHSDGTKTMFSNDPIHFGSVDPSAIPCHIFGLISRDTDGVLKGIGYTDEQIHAICQSEEIKQPPERRFGAYIYTGSRYRFYP